MSTYEGEPVAPVTRAEQLTLRVQSTGLMGERVNTDAADVASSDDSLAVYGIVDMRAIGITADAAELGQSALDAMTHEYGRLLPVEPRGYAGRRSGRALQHAGEEVNDLCMNIPPEVMRFVGAAAVGLCFFDTPEGQSMMTYTHTGNARVYIQPHLGGKEWGFACLTLDYTTAVNNLTNAPVNSAANNQVDREVARQWQNYFAQAMQQKDIQKNDRERFGHRDRLTAGLGYGTRPVMATHVMEVHPRDQMLMVSAGVSLNLTDREINDIWLATHFRDVPQAIVHAAQERAQDKHSYRRMLANASAIVIRLSARDEVVATRTGVVQASASYSEYAPPQPVKRASLLSRHK
ncbi:MAG TPA: hypothetical protein VFT53_05440 [Candidatus Saccharimonadales bacterium]|nr:hypothetical protein [Candidatus Saccharimonadales bacterium]